MLVEGKAGPDPLWPRSRAFFSAQICAGVFPPSSAKVLLATPTGAAGAGAAAPGSGALVPVNVLPPPNLFATLGFGIEVNLSGPLENAADRSASDLVGWSSDPPVATGETFDGTTAAAPEEGCALARIAAMSTFPTGSYDPFTVCGLSSFVSPDRFAWALIAAMSTFPTGWYAPLTVSGPDDCSLRLPLKDDDAGFSDVNALMSTCVRWYAGWTFSSWDLVTGGASAPHPSTSVVESPDGAARARMGL